MTHETEVRVRYGEVDQMGFLYHSHYVEYYDLGRNELIRSIGVTQMELEKEDHIMIPVLNVNIDYITPAHFDDVLVIRITLREMPRVKVTFYGEIFRNGELINHASVTLAFINSETKRAVRPPKRLIDALKPYFNN
ncbi:MAG: thioesterase family protein [Rikenellaceae bacterium]